MIVWKDVPVLIKHKFLHKRGLKKPIRYARALDWGDIPIFRFNRITRKVEPVENRRGMAYAARKRSKYKKKYKRK